MCIDCPEHLKSYRSDVTIAKILLVPGESDIRCKSCSAPFGSLASQLGLKTRRYVRELNWKNNSKEISRKTEDISMVFHLKPDHFYQAFAVCGARVQESLAKLGP